MGNQTFEEPQHISVAWIVGTIVMMSYKITLANCTIWQSCSVIFKMYFPEMDVNKDDD